MVEAGAGEHAGYPDALYVEKGAKIVSERASLFGGADIVVQVLGHGANDINGKADLPLMRRGQVLIGFLRPFGPAETLQEIAQTGVTSFAIELMPRTTRAQSMDALSSMATISGYKAVLIAADTLPETLSDDDYRSGNCDPGARPDYWSRSGRIAGDCHRSPVRGSRFGLRHEARGQRASAEPGWALRRTSNRSQECAGRPRVRHRAGRKLLCQAA